MTENCNPNNCPLEPRVEVLERANEQHTKTHREIFRRMNDVERDNAVQEERYTAIAGKLDEISATVKALADKPAKRWDGLVDKLVYAAALAVVAWVAAGMPGLK